MTENESVAIRLQSTETVEVDGMEVPPGVYPGIKKTLGTPYMEKWRLKRWEYWIVLVDVATLDATPQVEAGKFTEVI
jgi:hypothetical protein